jgi:hypothetical protein
LPNPLRVLTLPPRRPSSTAAAFFFSAIPPIVSPLTANRKQGPSTARSVVNCNPVTAYRILLPENDHYATRNCQIFGRCSPSRAARLFRWEGGNERENRQNAVAVHA